MTEPGPEAKVVRRRERRSWMSGMPLLVIPLLAYVAFADRWFVSFRSW